MTKTASKPAARRPGARKAAPRKAAGRPAALPADSRELEAAIAAVLARRRGADTAAPAADGPGVPAAFTPKPKPRLLTGAAARRVLAPFGWIAVTDAGALLARLFADTAGPAGQAAGAAALALAAAALTRTLIRLRRKRERKAGRLPKLTAAERRARRRTVAAWASAAAWAQLVLWLTPVGPFGAVQDLLLLGGLLLGSGHLFRHRQVLAPAGLRAAVEAAPRTAVTAEENVPDPRLEAFRRRFIDGTGSDSKTQPPLHRCELSEFAEVDGGFSFEVTADPETNVKFSVVAALRPDIASLYDVPEMQVLVDEASSKPSARRAKVLVLTLNGLFSDPERWGGQSTYDPATGAFVIGRFGDAQPAHWRLHAPRSGMWGGAIYGGQGTGKSGDIHMIAAQAGIVMACTACGAYREQDGRCAECEPSRLFMTVMGDPQKRAFSVWKGRADLVFWGADACVLQQIFLYEVMCKRDDAGGDETWTDAKGRTREGRGWFDPAPGLPGIVSITDEWPKVINSEHGKIAVGFSEMINREGRKSGLGETIAAQMPDADHTGDSRAMRELLKVFNTIAHRLDGTGRAMTGIAGNAKDLPSGSQMHGVGYIGGMDDRSAAPYRTLEFPEDAADGVDVLDMAEAIRELPLALDPAVQRVMDAFGFTRGMVVTDELARDIMDRLRETGTTGRGTVPARAADSRPGPGPVSAGALEAVAAALAGHQAEYGAPAELFDVMAATGLGAGPARRALADLMQDGRAVQSGPGEWSPAAVSSGA